MQLTGIIFVIFNNNIFIITKVFVFSLFVLIFCAALTPIKFDRSQLFKKEMAQFLHW